MSRFPRPVSIGLALLALACAPAYAQRTQVYQSGTLGASSNIAKFTSNGLIVDGKGLLGDANGKGLNPFAITDLLGLGLCSNSAASGVAYRALCLGHDVNGNALLAIDSYGGATAKDLIVRLNGTSYVWPGPGAGTMVGPGTSTVGSVPVWNNTTGTLVSDSSTTLTVSAGQVTIGRPPTSSGNKFFVEQIDTNPTSDSAFGHFAIVSRQDFQPTTDTGGNTSGVYGTLWYNAPVTFSGSGAAVRGNAYTIAQPAGAPITIGTGTSAYAAGLYGRFRHESAGVVTHGASVVADGCQNAGAGSITNCYAMLWFNSGFQATNVYGLFVSGPDASYTPKAVISGSSGISLPILAQGGGTIKLNTGNLATITTDSPINVGDTIQNCHLKLEGSSASAKVTANGTNCNAVIAANGTGIVQLQSNGLPAFNAKSPLLAVNVMEASGSTAGNPVTLSVDGADAAIGFVIQPKGAGVVKFDTKSIQIGTLNTPASATDACVMGTLNIDTGFIYVCTATNTWERVAIATW